jgi:S-DNA-T family DNA segregation ATPase FtsK/SpoIIIE
MVDSRVILDTPGAEKLLGRGDMLFIPPDQAKPTRIQGAYVSEPEIKRLIEFISKTGIRLVYTDEVTEVSVSSARSELGGNSGSRDEFFIEAVREVCQFKRASASLLQRRFSIGYNRAAKILDQMEEMGVIGPANGSKPRDILVKNAEDFLTSLNG